MGMDRESARVRAKSLSRPPPLKRKRDEEGRGRSTGMEVDGEDRGESRVRGKSAMRDRSVMGMSTKKVCTSSCLSVSRTLVGIPYFALISNFKFPKSKKWTPSRSSVSPRLSPICSPSVERPTEPSARSGQSISSAGSVAAEKQTAVNSSLSLFLSFLRDHSPRLLPSLSQSFFNHVGRVFSVSHYLPLISFSLSPSFFSHWRCV